MVTLKRPSSPAAMACSPRGLLIRKSPPFASCSSWLTSRTVMRARSSVELRAGAGADFAAESLRAMSGAPAPDVDGGRLRLPYARHIDAGQRRQRTKLGAQGDPVVRLGHHRRLAGDGIAQHRKAVAGTHHKGVEPIEIVERALPRRFQAVALARAPGQIGGRHL